MLAAPRRGLVHGFLIEITSDDTQHKVFLTLIQGECGSNAVIYKCDTRATPKPSFIPILLTYCNGDIVIIP
jgi:hypothetical protein